MDTSRKLCNNRCNENIILRGEVMKEKLTLFDKMMAAITFAEANEHNAGKEFVTSSPQKEK